MNLDFIWRFNAYINTLALFAASNVGNLTEGPSVAVTALPGGINSIYYDGVRDQDYNVSIASKSKKQQECIEALNTVMDGLISLNALPSLNGSYDFDRVVVNNPPSFIGKDEQGYFIYELNCIAKITINKGEN